MLDRTVAAAQLPRAAGSESDCAAWKRRTAFAALLLFAVTTLAARIPVGFFPLHQVQTQDLVPLFALATCLLVSAFWRPAWRFPSRLAGRPWLFASGFVAAALLAVGTYTMMRNFPVSVDERMVMFDMAVFQEGRFATPLPYEWRPFATALVPSVLLHDTLPSGLVSAYLPMNALLRLAFAELAEPALLNPLLAVLGGAALLDIARRKFGQDDAACWVVLLIYALSAQMLVNAMTVYSMTAHMALNLIWLAFFLRGGRLGYTVALITGFVATGLHQLVFHLFFVAPFLLWRAGNRDWRPVLTYGAAYVVFLIWWASYPIIVSQFVADAAAVQPSTSLAARVSAAFAERRGDTLITMVLNLLRFVSWQHLALLPLLLAGSTVALRDRGLPAVLLTGIGAWLAFLTVVIPFQGHGWGYRYLHPYLGSFALLAGVGYRELHARFGSMVDGMVLGLSAITALVTVPWLIAAAHKFVAPYSRLERLVATQTTPMVLIDTERRPTIDGRWAPNAIEVVNNRPDLGNRPLRFSSRNMTPDLLAQLCRRGEITLISAADQRAAGFATNASLDSPSFARLLAPVQAQIPSCFVAAKRVAL